MFPLTWRGEVHRPRVPGERAPDAGALLDRIELALARRLHGTRRDGWVVRFRGKVLRWERFDPLAAASRGAVEVVEDAAGVRVRYELRFTGLFVLWLLATAGSVHGSAADPGVPPWTPVRIAALVALAYGLVFAASAAAFSRLLRRLVAPAPPS